MLAYVEVGGARTLTASFKRVQANSTSALMVYILAGLQIYLKMWKAADSSSVLI